MNSIEISNILEKHCSNFSGVFPANSLSSIKKNSFAILNSEEIGEDGAHWTAVYINDTCSEFFDSFGKTPEFYHKYWQKLLLKHSSAYLYNDERIQKYNTANCAKFCIFYVFFRSKGMSYKTLMDLIPYIDLDTFLNSLIYC